MRVALTVLAAALLASAAVAVGGAEAREGTGHLAVVRAKDMNEAQEYGSQICGNYGKRAYFMYKEAGKDGLDVYYFSCK